MTTREAQVNHRYGLSGFYTAAVTATNEAGSINAKTLVTIDNTKMYLLLAMK